VGGDVTDAPVLLITVKCFSHLRNALGQAEITLHLARRSTAADARRAVVALAPDRLDGLPLRVAVNHAFVEDDHALEDGDEVALIPPVQGG
jgi:molybdopterin converting factor small subunit